MFCQSDTEGRGAGTLTSALSARVMRMEAGQVVESLGKRDSQMSPFQPPHQHTLTILHSLQSLNRPKVSQCLQTMKCYCVKEQRVRMRVCVWRVCVFKMPQGSGLQALFNTTTEAVCVFGCVC